MSWFDENLRNKANEEKFEIDWDIVLKHFTENYLSGYKPGTRMYTFTNKYLEYMSNVNYMCRAFAYLLNLDIIDEQNNGSSGLYPNGVHLTDHTKLVPFKDVRWEFYRMMGSSSDVPATKEIEMSSQRTTGENILGGMSRWFNEFLYKATGKLGVLTGLVDIEKLQISMDYKYDYGVKFLVEPISINESMRNTTVDSSISNAIDSLYSSFGKEVSFLMDTNALNGVTSATIAKLNELGNKALERVSTLALEGLGENYIASLTQGALGSFRGEKMIYPKIYERSEYSNTHRFKVYLSTPYGDVYNYYMNILVPLSHLICLASPRLITGNGTKAPFIIQGSIPGMCNINMGIITDMTITKNKSTSHVSVDGFPLDVEVEFTIEELYNSLPISSAWHPESFLANESLNGYLASMSGLKPSMDATNKILNLGTKIFKDYSSNWLSTIALQFNTGQ